MVDSIPSKRFATPFLMKIWWSFLWRTMVSALVLGILLELPNWILTHQFHNPVVARWFNFISSLCAMALASFWGLQGALDSHIELFRRSE